MRNTIFTEKVLIGEHDGQEEYLAAPSWDCDWYWCFGYLQNKDIHHHVDSLDRSKNLFDAFVEYYGDSLVLKDGNLWKFCELMRTFYTLKQVAEVYHRGGSHYCENPIKDILEDQVQYKKINDEILPKLFDEVYKLFKKDTFTSELEGARRFHR